MSNWLDGLWPIQRMSREELEREYPRVVIIDEASDIPERAYRDLIVPPALPVEKSTKPARRHHPVPQTPRRYRPGR